MIFFQNLLSTASLVVFLQISLTAQEFVPIKVASDSVLINDTLCVTVTASNFTEISGFQYAHNWQPGVLTFLNIKYSNLPGFNSTNFNSPVPGRLLVQWSSASLQGLTLDENELLYEICFKASYLSTTATVVTNGVGLPPAGEAGIYELTGLNLFANSINIPGYIYIYSNTSGTSTAASALTTPPFPNPFTNELHLKTPESEGLTFSLCDITGKEIQHTPIRAGNYTMSTSTMPEGIYVWQIRQDGQVIQAGKVVKARE